MVFGEGPTKVAEGAFTDTTRDPFTSEDIRFTTKDGTLYAIVLRYPENGIVNIKSLAKGSKYALDKIDSIRLLGYNGNIQWNCTEEGLSISITECKHCEKPIVFAIR